MPFPDRFKGFTGQDQPDEEIYQRCVRCGFCLPHCPTYVETLIETSSPRGRIHLIEAVAKKHLSLTDSGFVGQMYQCLDCRACEAVCPSGVEYGKLVEATRTQIERAQPGNPVKQGVRWLIFRQLFGKLSLFRLFSSLLSLYQRSGLRTLAHRLGLLKLLRLEEMENLLPQIPESFVIPENQCYSPPSITDVSPLSVAVFTGCVMSTAFAETDRATIRVLNQAGCEVRLPTNQGCCGALTIHAGDLNEARQMARRNIEAFEAGGLNYIVVNAAGCGAALKEYGHLLSDDPKYQERAARLSARVRDLTEFLVDQRPGYLQKRLPQTIGSGRKKITYQEPCHLVHAQRVRQEPRQLLQALPGIELIEMQESALCCGSAGIYNVTQPEMSKRLRERKISHILETNAEIVVTANPGCFLQLQAGLKEADSPIKVMHIADLLDEANRD